MALCECCRKELKPTLTMEQYEARSRPRLHHLGVLAGRIDFSQHGWELTSDGQRYKLLDEMQARDEVAAGIRYTGSDLEMTELETKFQNEYSQGADAREKEAMFKKGQKGQYVLMQVLQAWNWYERGFKAAYISN